MISYQNKSFNPGNNSRADFFQKKYTQLKTKQIEGAKIKKVKQLILHLFCRQLSTLISNVF
ncbi:type II secretory pathway component PulF [Pontibacter aydingkolensis]